MNAPLAAAPTSDAGRRFLAWLARRVGPPPRVLLLAAHPADESAAAGAQLRALAAHGLQLVVATDGAPREGWFVRRPGFPTRDGYAALRRAELEAARAVVQLPRARLRSLGAADHEVAQALVPLALEVTALVDAARPEVLLTHAYEGGHPDHDACALVARAAARRAAAPPALVEFPAYHDRDGVRVTSRFVAGGPPALELRLAPAARADKELLLACYRSQAEALADVDRTSERFRLAGPVDFGAPPHAGRLHYERRGWPLDGIRFRARAREALARLELPLVL